MPTDELFCPVPKSRGKESMNSRQRFQAIMHFQSPDRVPLWDLEGFTEEAIRRWCCQGFPPGRDLYEYV
ncbi:MAG: hypothetical protein ACUVWR_15225, partial [Anaerolineae bacterium]